LSRNRRRFWEWTIQIPWHLYTTWWSHKQLGKKKDPKALSKAIKDIQKVCWNFYPRCNTIDPPSITESPPREIFWCGIRDILQPEHSWTFPFVSGFYGSLGYIYLPNNKKGRKKGAKKGAKKDVKKATVNNPNIYSHGLYDSSLVLRGHRDHTLIRHRW
jgi:hypothetical protein